MKKCITRNTTVRLDVSDFPFMCLCVLFQVGPHGGRPPTVTASARATRASARAAPLSTTSPLLAPKPSRRPAPRRGPWSVGPWAGRPTSRRWTAPGPRAPCTCCTRPRCAARRTGSACEPSACANEKLQRGKPTRIKWRRSRSWRNASRTSDASGSPIASQRGSTCGNRSCWGSTVSKSEMEKKQKKKDRDSAEHTHTACKEDWNAYGKTLHTLRHNLYQKNNKKRKQSKAHAVQSRWVIGL